MQEEYKFGLDRWSINEQEDMVSGDMFAISVADRRVGTAKTIEEARLKLHDLVVSRVKANIEDARADILKWAELLGRIGDNPANISKFAKEARTPAPKKDKPAKATKADKQKKLKGQPVAAEAPAPAEEEDNTELDQLAEGIQVDDLGGGLTEDGTEAESNVDDPTEAM